jgi:hypothetical protein
VEPRHREPDGETADGSGWETATARRDFRFASYPAVGELGCHWTSVWVENSGLDAWAGLSAFFGPDVRGNTKLHP